MEGLAKMERLGVGEGVREAVALGEREGETD